MIRELPYTYSISFTGNLLFGCILLYSSRVWGSAQNTFTEKEPTAYNPSNVVTLLKTA